MLLKYPFRKFRIIPGQIYYLVGQIRPVWAMINFPESFGKGMVKFFRHTQ
jgi:hypothetical protein